MFSIGVVGYSAMKFDEELAILLLARGLDVLTEGQTDVEIVSGLTNIGIPAIVYQIATHRGYKTVGIACEKAFECELFPVDEQIITGDDWGDESEVFIERIDALLRVGGGKQSLKEVEMFKEKNGFKPEFLVEFELEGEK
jgi:hypothetical protein